MASRAVGVFDSVEAAESSRSALVAAGVERQRIMLSASFTSDDIAAEWPGQSYENQSYAASKDDTRWARFTEALHAGTCAMSVASTSGADCRKLRDLMQRTGARITLVAPHP